MITEIKQELAVINLVLKLALYSTFLIPFNLLVSAFIKESDPDITCWSHLRDVWIFKPKSLPLGHLAKFPGFLLAEILTFLDQQT